MGYRSDVVLVLARRGVNELQKALAQPELDQETWKETKSLLANAETHLRDPESGSELWHWKNLKWYTDYPEVAFLENFLAAKIREEDFQFIRIGEDWDDLETLGLWFEDPFDLRLIRRIDFASA